MKVIIYELYDMNLIFVKILTGNHNQTYRHSIFIIIIQVHKIYMIYDTIKDLNNFCFYIYIYIIYVSGNVSCMECVILLNN